MWMPAGTNEEFSQHPVLRPIELLRCFWSAGESEFRARLLGEGGHRVVHVEADGASDVDELAVRVHQGLLARVQVLRAVPKL